MAVAVSEVPFAFNLPLFVLHLTFPRHLEKHRKMLNKLDKFRDALAPELYSSQWKTCEYNYARICCEVFAILMQQNGLLMQSFKLLRFTPQAWWMLYTLKVTNTKTGFALTNQLK